LNRDIQFSAITGNDTVPRVIQCPAGSEIKLTMVGLEITCDANIATRDCTLAVALAGSVASESRMIQVPLFTGITAGQTARASAGPGLNQVQAGLAQTTALPEKWWPKDILVTFDCPNLQVGDTYTVLWASYDERPAG